MATPVSRFKPRSRLNWSADPLNGVDKRTITPGMGQAGLDYNKRLYAPGSPEIRRVFTPIPRATRPAPNLPGGYTGATAPVPAGKYRTPFGNLSKTEGVPNPNLADIDPSPVGSAGPAGDPGLSNPNIAEPAAPVDPPALDNPAFTLQDPSIQPTGLSLTPSEPTPEKSDSDFASESIAELDAILESFNKTAPSAASVDSQPAEGMSVGDFTGQSEQATKEDPAAWMTRPNNSAPAPVTFKKTNSSDWGSTTRNPQSRGPAPSTVRYYQRAAERAAGRNNRIDESRVRRLPLRIDARS